MKKILLILAVFGLANRGRAQLGTLDRTFGNSGKVLSETYEALGHSIAIQPDGKILAAGNGGFDGIFGFLTVRYNVDGSIDNQFGNQGRAINNLGESGVLKEIYKIALQSDGKIVAAGQYNTSLALMRYNSDGSVDTDFGENGLTIDLLSKTGYTIVRDMTLLPDGRIVIAGDLESDENDNRRSFMACYSPSGLIDQSFGQDGIVIINTSENADVKAVALTKDNKIVIGGNYTIYSKIILYEFLLNGEVNNSFGKNGFAFLDFNSDVYRHTMVDMDISSDNKIVVASHASSHTVSSFTCLVASKFLSNGLPDSSFGKNGYIVYSNNQTNLTVQALSIHPANQNLIIGGNTNSLSADATFLTSITPNGVIDSSFGKQGISYTTYVSPSDLPQALAIQEDGKIIVCGYSLSQNFPDYRYYLFLGRYEGYDLTHNKYVRIKKWLHRNGFTWEDWPGRNINYYLVQRSGDGNSFTQIAKIFQRPNNQYLFEDAAPLSGNNYYRVTAVNSNGSATQSNVISIISNNNEASIYPNPVTNTLQIAGLSKTQPTKLTITTFGASTLKSVVTNSENYAWNVSQLKPGNYILTITSGSNTVSKKFVKE